MMRDECPACGKDLSAEAERDRLKALAGRLAEELVHQASCNWCLDRCHECKNNSTALLAEAREAGVME